MPPTGFILCFIFPKNATILVNAIFVVTPNFLVPYPILILNNNVV